MALNFEAGVSRSFNRKGDDALILRGDRVVSSFIGVWYDSLTGDKIIDFDAG